MQLDSERLHEYCEHLKTISNGLMEMAKAAGRFNIKINPLLRECYNLVDVDLDTYEGWTERGARIRRGQHAYLFWKQQSEHKSIDEMQDEDVVFLFAKEQVEL